MLSLARVHFYQMMREGMWIFPKGQESCSEAFAGSSHSNKISIVFYLCITLFWIKDPMDIVYLYFSHMASTLWTYSKFDIELWMYTFHFHALEKDMATHSSVLAWRIPGTWDPGGLPSMGSYRVGHDWSDLAIWEIEK